MRNTAHLSVWKIILIGFTLLSVSLSGQVISGHSNIGRSGMHRFEPVLAAPAFPTDPVITINEPALTPPYNDDMCTSYWYRYTNSLGYFSYLTPNVQSIASSYNSAEWRPVLPQDGVYWVEAYIPSHPSLDWDCPNLQAYLAYDTSSAQYTIRHASGDSTVTIDQKPHNDAWVNLGLYTFQAGNSGSVTLTDLTQETKFTRTVSFSAMRFTYQPTQTVTLHLPAIINQVPTVRLDSIWTAAVGGHKEQSFYPGETILLGSNGVSTVPSPAEADFTWSVSGSCPSSGVFTDTYTSTLTLPIGDWTGVYTATVPACAGHFTYALQMDYRNKTSRQEMMFVVNDPGSGTAWSLDPAFDKCEIPTLAQAQGWWNSSPYRAVNLYIGGVHRACANTGLNAAWLRSASDQGWTFIPTWVGPQAPCSNFAHKISTNLEQAYQQGRAEANSAAYAASLLELPRDTVIYYDVEAYGTNATTACRNSVKSFMNGWVERLHERGRIAGAYGSPLGSYMADWAEILNPPDVVWIAVWYRPYQYDPNATVWVPNYLSNSLWPNHQRIRQYTNSHTETWGGIALTIDSNIADGVVATLPPAYLGANPSAGQEPGLPSQSKIWDVQLLTADTGWSLVDGRLLWTTTAGRQWYAITPAGDPILAAYFMDDRQGWAVAESPTTHALSLYMTGNAGEDWRAAPLPAPDSPAPLQIASIQFIDSQTGWIAFQRLSSSNFSLGELLRTTDGGKTWEQFSLPLGEPVRFTSPLRGWIAGGAGGNQLFTTQDGGQTWQPVALPVAAQPGQTFIGLPVFDEQGRGLLPVAHAGLDGAWWDVLATFDQGGSWIRVDQLPAGNSAGASAAPVTAYAGAGRWISALAGAAQVYINTDRPTLSRLNTLELPEGIISIQILPSGAGWARTLSGVCQGYKPGSGKTIPYSEEPFQCELRSQLWQTMDGGVTWTEITPE